MYFDRLHWYHRTVLEPLASPKNNFDQKCIIVYLQESFEKEFKESLNLKYIGMA
jgi:hypothetical protein